MPDLNDLMKQAQEMKTQMEKAQAEIAKKEVTGESGAGMVKVCMNGRHDVISVDIDASLMSEDKQMMEDLVAAAVNDAVRKVETGNRDALSGMAGGLDLSNFKMPF